MKKIIKILSQLSLVGGGTLSTVACSGNSIGGGVLEPGKPSNPDSEVKDRDYYLKLIAENEINIADCKELLGDIKRDQNNDEDGNKNNEEGENEYQTAINETNAEIYTYKAENYEYYYQIVLLRNNGTIDSIDKDETLHYLNKKINFLNKAYELKKEIIKLHPDEYDDNELKNIDENINQTNKIIEEINKIKEINNND